MDKIKIKNELKKVLNREPEEREIVNAGNDSLILNRILENEIEDLKARIKRLGG